MLLVTAGETQMRTDAFMKNEKKMNTVVMRSLRRICEVSLAHQIHNEEIHRMVGTSEDVTV